MSFPIHLRAKGRYRKHTPGVMNKTETRYSEHLAALVQARQLAWFRFDCIKLRLADKTFYSPDFLVMTMDGQLECHDAKGGPSEDDARVKIKVAASLFPFRFFEVRKTKNGWEREEF